VLEPPVPGRQHERGDQPLDIPLERAGQRLVEIVDIEHQVTIGGAEHPEVRQVRVTAELSVTRGPLLTRQVIGHDRRRPAIERERRRAHPPIPDRHQILHPSVVLRLQDPHRVLPAAVGRIRGVALQRRGLPPRQAPRDPLLHRPVEVNASGTLGLVGATSPDSSRLSRRSLHAHWQPLTRWRQLLWGTIPKSRGWEPRRGVSDERCKWPNTLSCGLARKGRDDRNAGRESTIIEGSS
jgi:hypothetical protein